MTTLTELQQSILNLNKQYMADQPLINLLTGVIVVVTILSMSRFKYTHSAAYRWSRPLYFTACILALCGTSINRFVSYPPTYPLSSVLYLLAYLFFSGYILYAGSTHYKREVKENGKSSIRTTKNHKSQR